MTTSNVVFKLRHKVTGLYSSGGTEPKWTRSGKTWSSKSAVGNMLDLVTGSNYARSKNHNDWYNWELVTLELSEKEVTPFSEILKRKGLK